MPDFSRRATTPELMDTEPCDFATFRDCLVDLARVNRMTFAYRPTLAFLDGLADAGRLPRNRPIHVVDAGSGYGDTLRQVHAWGRRRSVDLRLTGVDLNPWSAKAAAEATPADVPAQWLTADIFDYRSDVPVDLVLSSLFTHHLGDALLVRFLRWMEETARLGWLVNDLHRHPLPYHFFAAASRALRMHRFVVNDGPISIARSFVAADWRRFLTQAGIPEGAAAVRWWMPFRLAVSRVR